MKTTNTSNFTPAPETAQIDHKVIKKMVGKAISGIDGILDVKDSIADLLKDEDDLTRGLSVLVSDDNQVSVTAKVIVETGKNIPNIVNQATAAITDVLQNTAGLTAKDICVEVADTMDPAEYEQHKVLHPEGAVQQPPAL
ncbi:Asp23/Gls24 family envelope stress response protein [Clostridia bacterium OttesenSCG-928-O13]|nr:Asp23/Gls24 family envelope stress response protein [Clostridia bacterium OttesenSCG-928-O13]